ncbi:hypothetical protein SFUMM280S_03288 [Streptomyces fumanus]
MPQLLAFLPWLLVPVGFALLLSLLARSWLCLLWGVVLLGLLAWYLQPYGKTGDPIGQPVAELRILTSNVEFGQATGALTAAVRAEKPDLVFVQECDDACARTLRHDLAADYYYLQHLLIGTEAEAGRSLGAERFFPDDVEHGGVSLKSTGDVLGFEAEGIRG